MKCILFFFLTLLFSSCFLLNNEKFMLKKVLGNGIAIELDYSGGGATAPDIIWVKKITKDGQKTIVGQIKDFTDSDKVDIKEIDSNYIALKFLVTDFQDHPVVFTINLNNKIERNAGYPFNQPQRSN